MAIGADISSELSTCTKSTHLITRSGTWVWPRYLLGKPYEYLGSKPSYLSSLLPGHALIIPTRPLYALRGAPPRSNRFNEIGFNQRAWCHPKRTKTGTQPAGCTSHCPHRPA